MTWRIRYSKLGKVRFTSHRDSITHFERAARRAGLRVAMSQGFTARPRMSFGLGLPTGAESLAEYVDIDLVDAVDDLEGLAAVLSDALPIGYTVTAIALRQAVVEHDRLDVADMQIAVGLRRKARADACRVVRGTRMARRGAGRAAPRSCGVPAPREVVVDDVADEIGGVALAGGRGRAGCVGGRHAEDGRKRLICEDSTLRSGTVRRRRDV